MFACLWQEWSQTLCWGNLENISLSFANARAMIACCGLWEEIYLSSLRIWMHFIATSPSPTRCLLPRRIMWPFIFCFSYFVAKCNSRFIVWYLQEMNAPSFRVEKNPDGTFLLHYYSDRRGLCHIVPGNNKHLTYDLLDLLYSHDFATSWSAFISMKLTLPQWHVSDIFLFHRYNWSGREGFFQQWHNNGDRQPAGGAGENWEEGACGFPGDTVARCCCPVQHENWDFYKN